MGKLTIQIPLSKNGTWEDGTQKLAFIIPTENTKEAKELFCDCQIKVILYSKKKNKTVTFVTTLTKISDKRIKGYVPKKLISQCNFGLEEIKVTLESI